MYSLLQPTDTTTIVDRRDTFRPQVSFRYLARIYTRIAEARFDGRHSFVKAQGVSRTASHAAHVPAGLAPLALLV